MVNILSLPQGLIFDISVIIIIATFLAYLLRLIKQPLIPAYVIAGIILGPIGLNLFKDTSTVNSLSEIGIAFLLFIVGLELDLKKIKSVSSFAIIGGILQVYITAIIGFLAAKSFGFNFISAIYIGLVVAFSSTMLIVKILKDKEHVDTLHGRLMIGILVMQDILVIFVLSFLSTLSYFNSSFVLTVLLKGILLILLGLIIAKFVFPTIFKFAAKSEELLFLCSLAACFLLSLIAYKLGFSIAVGSFMAGVMLGSLPYSTDISGMVSALKNFFITIFFVSLGMQLVLFPKSMLALFAIVLLITIVVKPVIVMILASIFGYEKRTSFLASFSMGQISEFSLIMASLGFYTLGQISQDLFSLIIFATIISMVITSYTMKYDSWFYSRLSRFLSPFERLSFSRENVKISRKAKADIIILGCHRMGSIFLNYLINYCHKNIFVIDHNPEIIKELMQKKVDCLYGDCTNPEVLKKVDLKSASLIISAIPNLEINTFLISHARAINKKIMFIGTQNHLHEALDLYNKGADYVILPHISTSESSLGLLKKIISNKSSIREIRNSHIKHLLNLEIYG